MLLRDNVSQEDEILFFQFTDEKLKRKREILSKPVNQHTGGCIRFILTMSKTGPQAQQLNQNEPGSRSFAVVNIDYEDPFVTTSTKNRCVLVLTNKFKEVCYSQGARKTTAIYVVCAIKDVVLDFGAPIRIFSDRGTSRFSKDFCDPLDFRHTLNSPRHPQFNVLVVRTYRTLPFKLICIIKKDEIGIYS